MKQQAPNGRRPATVQQGFSLVEIMLALVLGSILTGGAVELYLNTKQAYRLQSAEARLQENGRYAMEILTRSIRGAGFRGCLNSAPNSTLNSATTHPYNFGIGIQGFEWTAGTATTTTATNWGPTLDTNAATNPSARSDIISIRGPIGNGVLLSTAIASTATNLTVPANTLNQCDLVIISDCISGPSLFQLTSASASTTLALATGACTPGNSRNALNKEYAAGALVMPLGTTNYFIGTGGSGEPALYRRINENTAEELVDGIENLQILYGVDTNNDSWPNQYLTANNVTNWATVISVRLNLLARTGENNLTATKQTYRFNETQTTATDNRIRQAFTATIGLRNRVP